MFKKGFAAALAIVLLAVGTASGEEFWFKAPKTRAELEAAVREGAATIRGRVGVYMKHVESGETTGFNERHRFQLASVFKIPVLVTLFKAIHEGKVSLDDRILFTQSMKTFGSGLMSGMKPGLNISVQDLQLLMMARSDNTATDILYAMVTPEAIRSTLTELGLADTTIDLDTRGLILSYLGLDPERRLTPAELEQLPASVWADPKRAERQKAFEASTHNTSTPADIGRLLEKCVKGEIVDRATSDQVLETMKNHTGAELILRYLPSSTEIARKGGSLAKDGEDTVLLDSAVVWLPDGAGHLVMCVWGNDLREVHYELKHKMGLIARAGYDYFLERNRKTKPGA